MAGYLTDLRTAKDALVRMAAYSAQESARSFHTPARPPVLTSHPVRVEALLANWCMGGQPVEVGRVYTVEEHEVVALELRGKARRV